MKDNNIEWRDIPRHVGRYQVSNGGSIYSLVSHITMTKGLHSRGYHTIRLWTNGAYERFLIHRLVMLVFVGECPNGMEVNHINGIKTDNHLANLEYCTRSENQRHALDVLNIKMARGEAQGHSKLTELQVREIRKMHAEGISSKTISAKYGVCTSNIRRIARRESWKHVE